jgi:threonine dehydrogenase-like Zn-dependent dehydrogenase
MRAAVMRNWELSVEDVDDPVPGPGQVLTKVLACGICGSDLHLLKPGARQLALAAELAKSQPVDPLRPIPLEPARPTIMGHEFCCEVVALGPECTNLKEGDTVVSLPVAFDTQGLHGLGFSSVYPGGYAELMVLNDIVALKVPGGLSPRLAALTEPLAVGVHAVNKSGIGARDAALVLGCGPVGLAVIVELRRRGLGPIVAADYSSARRRLAEKFGADLVVDPAGQTAIEAWRGIDGSRPLVIFEAVGVPGMLDQAMVMAPRDARILVVGVCMEDDLVRPIIGIGRELTIQFALGYDPVEFAGTLTAIADGAIDVSALITSTVAVDGVPGAFTDLANPGAQAKILVEP